MTKRTPEELRLLGAEGQIEFYRRALNTATIAAKRGQDRETRAAARRLMKLYAQRISKLRTGL